MWNRDAPRGLKLYVQRVFIMDEADQFLPLYLRFIRGVVDSGDLSLNVSRELLQQDAHVEAIKSALTKRVLDMIATDGLLFSGGHMTSPKLARLSPRGQGYVAEAAA